MNRIFKGISTLALLGLLAAPASSQMVPGTWYTFSWSGLGMMSQTFVVGGSGAMDIQVVDCCIVGDRFTVYGSVSGTMGSTSADFGAADGTQSGAFDGASAWADPDLSKGQFQGVAGETISLQQIRLAPGTTGGAGYIRTVTPEPGTVILMATGLLGLGVAMRRRQDDDLEV